ncbi:hypothetical protein C8T65DRAFT_270787 [Cerioporus squamosus]|nr:hypothetical protein C8T65DRAFT_270787 [Cerioporus squamosus]
MHTAWTKKGSSLPSDRIPSRTQTPQPAKGKGKGKGKEEAPPKSKEVRALEKLRDDLRNASGRERDPKGGCFCQGVCRACYVMNFIIRSCSLRTVKSGAFIPRICLPGPPGWRRAQRLFALHHNSGREPATCHIG